MVVMLGCVPIVACLALRSTAPVPASAAQYIPYSYDGGLTKTDSTLIFIEGTYRC